MTISEKVAYLKGLAEGLNLDTEKSKESKLISVMIGIMEEMAITIDELQDNADAMGDELDALEEELDAVSEDLEDVESLVYDDEDEDWDEDWDDDWEEDHPCCGRGRGHCHRHHEDEEDDEDFFQVACPTCGADITIDQSVLDARQVECPACGETFAIDLCDEDEEEEAPGEE